MWRTEGETFTTEIKAKLQHGVIMRWYCPCLWDVCRFSGWVVPAQWAYWSNVPLLGRQCDVMSRSVKARPRFAPRRSFEVVLRWDRCIGVGGIMWVTPAASTVITCRLMLRPRVGAFRLVLWPRVGAFTLNVFFYTLVAWVWHMVTWSWYNKQAVIRLGQTCSVRSSLFVISV